MRVQREVKLPSTVRFSARRLVGVGRNSVRVMTPGAGRRHRALARAAAGVLAMVVMAACSGGEAGKDTTRTPADSASPDIRAGAMSGAAAAGAEAGATPGVPGGAAAKGGAPIALIVGTSLTAGLGLDPNDAYPAVLQRMADSAGYAVRIENAGLSGETSAGALRRIGWLLQREPASLVMIETGANDGLRGLDVDSTRSNLRAIVREVRRTLPGATILLVQMEAPPNLGDEYTKRFRANYPEVAREEGVGLVPFLLDGVAGVRSLNQGDGIHPNVEGAKRVARNLWGALAPHLSRLAKGGGAS